MEHKPIRRQIYFRLDETLITKLDRRIQRIGYPSRSDFFEAVAYATLYRPAANKQHHTNQSTAPSLPDNLTEWLCSITPEAAEEHIQQGLQTVIENMLYPVIAMKGIDIAFDSAWEDIRHAYHEQSGIWTTESDIREACTAFAAIRKPDLDRYREQQLKHIIQQEQP